VLSGFQNRLVDFDTADCLFFGGGGGARRYDMEGEHHEKGRRDQPLRPGCPKRWRIRKLELEAHAEAHDPRVHYLGDVAECGLICVAVLAQRGVGVEQVEDVHDQSYARIVLKSDHLLDAQVDDGYGVEMRFAHPVDERECAPPKVGAQRRAQTDRVDEALAHAPVAADVDVVGELVEAGELQRPAGINEDVPFPAAAGFGGVGEAVEHRDICRIGIGSGALEVLGCIAVAERGVSHPAVRETFLRGEFDVFILAMVIETPCELRRACRRQGRFVVIPREAVLSHAAREGEGIVDPGVVRLPVEVAEAPVADDATLNPHWRS